MIDLTKIPRYGCVPPFMMMDSRLTHAELRIACLICLHSSADSGCHVSQSKLAEMAGVSRQTVSGAISKMRGFGWLTVDARFREDGSQTTSTIRVLMDIKVDASHWWGCKAQKPTGGDKPRASQGVTGSEVYTEHPNEHRSEQKPTGWPDGPKVTGDEPTPASDAAASRSAADKSPETDQSPEEVWPPPDPEPEHDPNEIVFEGQAFRLNRRHRDKWANDYDTVDLEREVPRIDAKLAKLIRDKDPSVKGRNPFWVANGWIRKAHLENCVRGGPWRPGHG